MPDFLSSWRLDVTPLAPVHVGGGEDMDPTSYVLDTDALYEFSPDALAAALDEGDRTRLLELADGKREERVLTGVQQFIFERRDGIVAHASRTVRVAPGVRELYETRIGTVAQTETRTINQLEIERVFSHPETRNPILPGSSVKGAIRTALLNRQNAGGELDDANESSLKLQQRLFDYRRFQTDPMRLVHVADAMDTGDGPTEGPATNTTIVFAVNRKKRKITGEDGREIRSQAERKGLYQTLEVVPPLRWRGFRGALTIHRSDLPAPGRLPKADLRWSAEEIANACNRFYRPNFKRETDALRDRGLLDERWYRSVQALMEGVGELLDANRAFLLRVGRHSGAESVTLDGVRNIRIMTPRDQPQRWEEEATTWWLASDRTDASSGLLPFGWVLVEMTEGDNAPEPRSEIAEVLHAFHAESGEAEWRREVMHHQATLRRKQEADAAKRADTARRRREQEAAERDREARRGVMTDEERILDDLRYRLDSARRGAAPAQGQGGELAGAAIRVLKEANGWPEGTRRQAADLIEEVFTAIGFPKGKKGRERRRQISALREGTQ